MTYISVSFFLFILLSFSNFLILKFNFKNNQSYFITCCIIILITYFVFFLDKKYEFDTLNYLIFFLILLSILVFLLIILDFSTLQKSMNIEFIIFFFIILYFSYDRYYLDQDEFTYWGPSLKELLLGLRPYEQFIHHPKGTSLFQYLLVFFNYKEGLAIFANNILLLSAFFYLFYERKLLIYEKIILFFIYYLLLNNLSFGFLSIYSDPVLAVFFCCLLKLIYFNIIEKNNVKIFQFYISFGLISLSLLLINRASIIFLFFSLIVLYFFFINKYQKKKIFFFFLFSLIVIFIFFYEDLFLKGNYLANEINEELIIFFKYTFFKESFVKLFTSPIYFSNFGSLVNGILNFLSLNFFFPQLNIPLISYILLLGLILLFNFKYKFFFISFSFFSILIYSVIVYILKFQIEKLSILALQRYIAIFLLAQYFFYISIINRNYESYKNYKNCILIFFFLLLIFVTPKKTLGFFVTDEIYYSNASNRNFKINRDKISKIKDIKNINSFFLIHKYQSSDYTNNHIGGEHTFYSEIISYELYPKKIIALEYEDFINDIKLYKILNDDNALFIFYDLSNEQLTKIVDFKNYLVINTY
jgi:hypothetical protein